MRYSYRSNGIVSRPIPDHVGESVSSRSNQPLDEFWYKCLQTQRISDVNYGSVGTYGAYGISTDTTSTNFSSVSPSTGGTGSILIVGSRGRAFISGSATCFAKRVPLTSINCNGGVCVYSYEAGNISETVGQHGSSVINAGIGARKINSFQFVFDTWQSISRFTGAAECRAYIYEPCITEDYNELDYGLISANHTATIDNGLVSHTDSVTITDRGNILDGYRTRFGFSKTIGEAQAKATNAWIGSGRIRKFGRQTSPAIYGYIVDGKVKGLSGIADVAFSTQDLGGGLTPLSGSALINITAITIGDGSLKKFSGAAESATWNPDEKHMLFSFTGGLTAEKHVESYVGSGRIKNLAKVEAEKGTFDYVGSGKIKLFSRKPELVELSDEKHTEVYNGSAVLEYEERDWGIIQSGCSNIGTISTSGDVSGSVPECIIKVDQGVTARVTSGQNYQVALSNNAATNFIDYGLVSEGHSPSEDWGWILDWGTKSPYGLFRFDHASEAGIKYIPSWIGSGTIRFIGDTAVPLDVGIQGTGTLFSMGGAAETSSTAEQGGGLYRIDGATTYNASIGHIGSGSLKKFSGAAESITFNPLEKQLLFSFTSGYSDLKYTFGSYNGSGVLFNFSGLDERSTFDYVGSGGIKLRPRKPVQYELEELANFTLDNYTLQYDFIDLGNIDFYNEANTNLGSIKLQWLSLEQSHEKHTEAYNNSACEDAVDYDYGFLLNQNPSNCIANSGTISTNTTATSGCIKVAPGTTLSIAPGNTYTIPSVISTPTDSEDYGLVSEATPQQRDYGWILGTRSKLCPYGAFDITGSAKTHYVENIITTGYSVSGKAGVSIFGVADTFWTPPYHGSGLGRLVGTLTQSFTPAPHIGSGVLFSMGGAAETTSVLGYGGGLFKIGSQGYTLFSLLHPGSGLIRITGTGAESFTPTTYIGSGSLKKFSGAAESATWNPLEKQMLFSFTGTGSETFTANPPEEGTQVRISGDAFPVFFIPKYPGSGLINISGEGDTDRTRSFVGSGSLKKFSGAAESITFNPEEKQLLFSFTGTGTEKVTFNPPEEGTDIRLRGEADVIWKASYFGSGRIPVTGIADTDRTRSFFGSGSLKKFSGAAESITFNPEEKQLLFSFTGTGSERTFVVPPEGDGILFTFGGSTATSAAAYESTGLFRVGGFTDFTRSRDFIGSGSLKKFSGGAESLTVNPDEKQMLFSFTGASSESAVFTPPEGSGRIAIYPEAADYRFTPNWNSVGGVRIEIQSTYRFAPVWIGSGSLKKFSGAAESITFNPEEKQMLFSFVGERISEKRTSREISKGGTVRLDGTPRVIWVPNNIGSGNIFVSGTATTHYVPHITGSGSLYNFSGAAESKSVDITSIPSLFRVYGNSDIARSRPYIGSGSLKKFQGAAESITLNPDEKQMLFSFLGQGATTRTTSESGQGTVKTLGESTVRFSPVYIGSGTTRVSGEVYVTRTRDFVGFGSLKKLSGAAESITFNPDEKHMLFSFFGVGAESRTSRELSQSGVLAVRGTSGDPLLTFAEQPEVQVAISGDSYDLRTHAYQGSGRISNVNNLDEAFVRTAYQGSGRIAISGIAIVQVQLLSLIHI